jgi:Domain of unknown function (DUF4190)/N-terminal domain of toast_rack, DUF2154
MPAPARPTSSGFAVASLILGVAGLTCLPVIGGILALVFGLVARGQIKREPRRISGKGMAVTGIVLGTFSLTLVVLAATGYFITAFIFTGDTHTVTRGAGLQGAEEVRAELDISNGGLQVEGGASGVVEGQFTFNVNRWEPEVEYEVRGGRGLLKVNQPNRWTPHFWNAHNDWHVSLVEGVPIDLSARSVSARMRLDLASLTLSALDVDSISGDVYADLSGPMDGLSRVRLKETSGDIELYMQGKYPGGSLDLGSVSGDILADLAGEWDGGLQADINTTSGDVTLTLPGSVGVQVTFQTTSGDVSNNGLRQEGGRNGTIYVNDAFETSEVRLFINVHSVSGDLELRLND